MTYKYFIIFILAFLSYSSSLEIPTNQPIHWAVLVAGSKDMWNYRHQADVLHAYHLLVNNWLSPDHIILFAYDDIAYNSENPFPGQIFNFPGRTGWNVHEGVKIDYSAKEVTPENFLNVILGDKEKLKGIGTERVLESGPNDNVFIFFSDHGAEGYVCFPDADLYADNLITTLHNMHNNKKYKELVFYLEACESGSMFEKILPKDINVYTTTAANPSESSYATFCPPNDDVVEGKHIGTCLGDEYSLAWMSDTETDRELHSSLQQQFTRVKNVTKGSHVQQYGQLTFSNKDIGQYLGNHIVEKKQELLFLEKRFLKEEHPFTGPLVDSRDVKLMYLYSRAQREKTEEAIGDYYKMLQHVHLSAFIFHSFNNMFGIDFNQNVSDEIDFPCLKAGIKAYKEECRYDEYDLKYVKNISFACKMKIDPEELRKGFKEICKEAYNIE